MRSTYNDGLQRLTDKINCVLKTELEVKIGTGRLWKYQPDPQSPPMYFPLESKPSVKSQISYVTRRKRVVANPDYMPHIKQGRATIKTPWGQFMVIGELDKKPPLKSGKKYWYWVIAQCLQSRHFSSLRMCRDCQVIFPAKDLRKATCLECGDMYNVYRAEKNRRFKVSKKIEEEREKQEKEELAQFEAFLTLARGNVQNQLKVGKFIKKRIFGDWTTVVGWLKAKKTGFSTADIWSAIPNNTKQTLRQFFSNHLHGAEKEERQ